MPRNIRRSKLDAQGWRIPRDGTKSRLIYEGLKAGLEPAQIAEKTGQTRNSVSVLACKIRNAWMERREEWALIQQAQGQPTKQIL